MLRSFTSHISKSIAQQDSSNYLLKITGRNILVTSYHWPDSDGIAGSYALAEWLKTRGNNAHAMKWQEPQMEASWAMSKLSVTVPDIEYQDQDIVLVDVSNPRDIPSFLPIDRVQAIIDHRLYFDITGFPKTAYVCIEPVGSACSLVCRLLREQGYIPSKPAANLLYLAIMSNTIKCRSHNTTEIDLAAVEWLQPLIDINLELVDEMFLEKSKITDIQKAINDDTSSTLQVIAGLKVAVAQLEILHGEEFLNNNKDEILAALEAIKKERLAEDIFLIVVDTGTFVTHFVNVSVAMQPLLESKYPLKPNNYYATVEDICLRKEVIAELKESIKVDSKNKI